MYFYYFDVLQAKYSYHNCNEAVVKQKKNIPHKASSRARCVRAHHLCRALSRRWVVAIIIIIMTKIW